MSLRERPLPVQVKVHERNVSVNNVEVKARHLWGCDVYTDDSDVVAALMHCGFHEAAKAHNPPGVLGPRSLQEWVTNSKWQAPHPPACGLGLWAGQPTCRQLHSCTAGCLRPQTLLSQKRQRDLPA